VATGYEVSVEALRGALAQVFAEILMRRGDEPDTLVEPRVASGKARVAIPLPKRETVVSASGVPE
jgi:hypothetical protein